MFLMNKYDWNNHEILQRGRKPARVHFIPFGSREDALHFANTKSDRITMLNGTWGFDWYPTPTMVTEQVIQSGDSGHKIEVPMNWQFAGFGRFCYTDVWYPFPVNPPHIPMENETGVYSKIFHVDKSMLSNLSIRFEGVESAFHVYVNGVCAGYSQGSRIPSEFDITALVHEGENRVRVVVYMYSDGSYLEDQDMWWLGGIIRDVYLIARRPCHLENLVLNPDYDVDSGEGILQVRPKIAGVGKLTLQVLDGEDLLFEKEISQEEEKLLIPGISPWNAEQPHLYTVLALLRDETGKIVEVVPQRVGFRHVEIKEGTLLLNGQRILMKGVNRHEYDPKKGRTVTQEQTRADLLLIKSAGMNAVRTSHYPNNPFFYDLCNELGVYVIDECDLETHGFEAVHQDTRLCMDSEWLPAYLDRLERMVERDRNNACVLLWSLGNESSYGDNFRAMYHWCKKNEPSRPVHYEGDFKNQTVDVSSTMYSTVGKLRELDTELSPKRPHIHCEFGHAMGNGPGSLAEYFDVCEHSNRIQGMFVWEFMDQGVYHEREDGCGEYLFGGELGEKFHNGNFCMDGLLASDRTPTTGFYEYARVIENVHLVNFDCKTMTAQVKNRWDFLSLDDVVMQCVVLKNGEEFDRFILEIPKTEPHGTAQITIDREIPCLLENADVMLDFTFVLKKNLPWCKAGWTAGTACFPLREYHPAPCVVSAPAAAAWEDGFLVVRGRNICFRISPVDGCIYDYRQDGRLLLEKGPVLNFFRAYLDNDIKAKPKWQENHIDSMQMCVHSINYTEENDLLKITVQGRFAPGAMLWGAPVSIVYCVDWEGRVGMGLSGCFEGDCPDYLPKIGTQMRIPLEYDHVTYRGFGPGECYCDSKTAAKDGIWSLETKNLSVDYLCPQDNGNRTQTRWAVLQGETGGIAVGASRPLDFSIRGVEDNELNDAKHSCDVKPTGCWLVNLDYCNTGLGSASCGPEPLNQYRAYSIPFAWSMAFVPVNGKQHLQEAGREALDYLAALRWREENN